MATHWHVTRGKDQTGPFTAAELRRQVATGTLRPTDMLLKDGSDKWVSAASIRGLFPAPAPHSPPGDAPRFASRLVAAVAGGGLCLACVFAFLWYDAGRRAKTDETAALQAEVERLRKNRDSPDDGRIRIAHSLPTDDGTMQRDKLAADKAEVERLRREIELKVAADAERERQRLVREQQAADARNAALVAAEKAKEYTEVEYAAYRDFIVGQGNVIGSKLLVGTHPTGAYVSTGIPGVVLSADRRTINVSVTVDWKGGILGNLYQTTYATTLTKEGMGTLRVLRDTAIIQIDPQFLLTTEYALKEQLGFRR